MPLYVRVFLGWGALAMLVPRYLARACPKCRRYVGLVIPAHKRNVPVQAINGCCAKWGYRLAWLFDANFMFSRYNKSTDREAGG